MMGNNLKPFTRELKAISEDDIREKIYSEFGSKHRINRKKIFIDKIAEITEEEAIDPLIKDLSRE